MCALEKGCAANAGKTFGPVMIYPHLLLNVVLCPHLISSRHVVEPKTHYEHSISMRSPVADRLPSLQ